MDKSNNSSPTGCCQPKHNQNHPKVSEVVHTGSLKPLSNPIAATLSSEQTCKDIWSTMAMLTWSIVNSYQKAVGSMVKWKKISFINLWWKPDFCWWRGQGEG